MHGWFLSCVCYVGVIPVNKSCQEFVMKQRKSQFEDLSKALKALNARAQSPPKEQMFLQMWLMEQQRLTYDLNVLVGIFIMISYK